MTYTDLKVPIPNLKIISDGTPLGTLVTVDGKELVGIQSIKMEINADKNAEIDIKILSSDFQIKTTIDQINFTELNLPKDFYQKEEI